MIGLCVLMGNLHVFAKDNKAMSLKIWQHDKQANNLIIKLQKKYNVFITYESDLFKDFTPPPEDKILNAGTIEKAFDEMFKGTKFRYKKMRKDFYIILMQKKIFKESNLPSDTSIVIDGVVYDEAGIALPGANVLLKGTSLGTITDLDGHFTLKIKNLKASLVVKFIGYQIQEKKIANQRHFEFKLEPQTIGLDEVVVAGVAGKTSVKKLTVTVEKINAEQLNEAPASSVATSLQGKIAGVHITQAFGTPGSGASIRLRGSTSITGNQAPLILVDGNIFESSLADMNVDDIQSIEVVKGAAAASLYGSKAGSGVILITTKRASNLKEGKTQIKVRNEYGVSAISKKVALSKHHPYLLADDHADYSTFTKYAGVRYDDKGNVVRGSRRLDNDHYADNPYGVVKNNQANFFNPGNYYTNYISIANRSKKTNIFVSFENNKQSGILFATKGYKRQNFRVNVDQRISDKLKFSSSNLLINTKSDNPGSNNAFFDLLFLSPDVNLEAPNADGAPYNIKPDPWSLQENPLYPLYYRKRKSLHTSLLSNAIITYEPIEWISLKAKYTIEKQNKHWSTYTPRGYLYGGGQYIDGSIFKEQYTSTYQTFQTTAFFNKIFGKLTTKAKLSYLYEDKSYYDFSVTGREFITADVPQLNNTNPEKASLNSYQGIIRAENIFGILDMDYKGRYLISGLYRMDGSSLFGADERWNPYYRLSAAYRISQDFKIPGFDELKIRAAYGTAGQRPGFSYQYETWKIINAALRKSTLGNKNLKPSESGELEIALDASLLGKINLQISYSNTNTKDVFALAPLASNFGYPSQWKNVGTLSAKSYEAALGINLIDKKNLHWKFNITFDRIRQKITKLNIPQYKTGPKSAFLIAQGETLGAIYGYRWLTRLDELSKQLQEGQKITDYTINSDGYVIPIGTEGTVNEKPILWDKDGNGVPDLTKIGDGNPDFHMGFNNTFSWKNFQIYALIDWKQGGNIYNYTHQYTFRDNRAIEFDQFGKNKNQKKTIDYYSNFYYHTALNSYFVEDGTYVKLREFSMYYKLKTAEWGFLKGQLSSIRFGLVGHNLYTFTHYSGYDPEVASGSDLSNFPFDNFGYPNYRTFTASIEFKF